MCIYVPADSDHAHRPQFRKFRFGSARLGSVRFCSVRKNTFPRSMRFGLRFFGRIVARSGSVPRPLPKSNGSVRFGSVRPVRFGLLFLPANLSAEA